MPAKDKDAVMRRFREGEVDVLVSTAVVEVGIDVANATVMLIEGADRFGLAQLHQFRGRVGRGEHKSYCILLSDSPSEGARERLGALEQIHDGFQLAEVDLELRGPGDFFGTRQSGLPNLRMAQLSDRKLLETARDEAARVRDQDPELAAPEHAGLAAQVRRFLDQVSAEGS
jgi:ATP-dependent DNA helicase RecG